MKSQIVYRQKLIKAVDELHVQHIEARRIKATGEIEKPQAHEFRERIIKGDKSKCQHSLECLA